MDASSAPGTVVAVQRLIEGIDAWGRWVAGEVPAGRDSLPVRGLVEVDLCLGRSPSGGGARDAKAVVATHLNS